MATVLLPPQRALAKEATSNTPKTERHHTGSGNGKVHLGESGSNAPSSPTPTPTPSDQPAAPGGQPAQPAKPATPSPVGREDGGDDDSEDGPKTDPNPLNPAGNSIDTLIQKGINADLWNSMKGDLPCTEATSACLAQLQEIAATKNPMLKEIDNRIDDIQGKIDEAKKQNKTSIDLAVFKPAAQVFLQPSATTQPKHGTGGVLGKLFSIFTGPVGIVNEVLGAVGMPLFDKIFGGNEAAQSRSIAIGDLEVKLAEIQRGRAELADKVREQVQTAMFDFDDARREFQVSQEVSKREASRMQLTDVEYRLGEGTSESYLGQLSSLDKNKAATWRSWSAMRSRLEKIKLIVLGVDE